MHKKTYVVWLCVFALLYPAYRAGFFFGTQFGENQVKGLSLPRVVHSFKNVSVSKSRDPHVITFRVSFQDGVPAAGALINVENDSGLLSKKTDDNGFVEFYYGKSSFTQITVNKTEQMKFEYNTYAESLRLEQYGLDFCIILNK